MSHSVGIYDYWIGSMGIDSITTTTAQGTSTAYPLYDAHGNMVSTLARGSQSGTYAWTPERIFDAWGVIRSGNNPGDPKGRYCANLGHKQDDESGLVYMRARYYEPSSGRFLSSDPACHATNWFAYADGQPTGGVDSSGRSPGSDRLMLLGGNIQASGDVLDGWGSVPRIR